MSVSTRHSHSCLLPTGVGEFLHLLWARELPLSDRCHLVTVFHVEASGSPRFLGNPSCSHAPLSDPGGPAQSHRLDWTDTAFRIPDDVGPAFNRAFEALSRGLTARCLRFATRVTPDHARLATDPLVRLWPGGTCTHWVTYSLDFQRGIGAPPLLSSQAYPGAPRGRDRPPRPQAGGREIGIGGPPTRRWRDQPPTEPDGPNLGIRFLGSHGFAT